MTLKISFDIRRVCDYQHKDDRNIMAKQLREQADLALMDFHRTEDTSNFHSFSWTPSAQLSASPA
jgi:hypothetical protein